MEHGTHLLDLIQECYEEESEEEDSDEEERFPEFFNESTSYPTAEPLVIFAQNIPQAFSHFTYHFFKRRMMVYDLQGVWIQHACLHCLN